MKIAHILIIFGFIVFGGSCLAVEAHAAGFIKFEGIDGEATDQDHKDWINLLSISELPETFADSSSSRTRGETTLGDITIVKELDKSSPKLSEAVLSGKTFSKIEIQTKSDDGTYLTYELENVILTSYAINGDANSRPTEEIVLNFEKIMSKTSSEFQGDKSSQGETRMEQIPKTDDELNMMTPKVPSWVQTTAQFWIDENVSDREFTDALGFLVKERIIKVDVDTQVKDSKEPSSQEPQVPAWIATTTKWWIDGQVPEEQFLEGIKWMIENRIIRGL